MHRYGELVRVKLAVAVDVREVPHLARRRGSGSGWGVRLGVRVERRPAWRSVSTGRPERSRMGRTPMPLTCRGGRAGGDEGVRPHTTRTTKQQQGSSTGSSSHGPSAAP